MTKQEILSKVFEEMYQMGIKASTDSTDGNRIFFDYIGATYEFEPTYTEEGVDECITLLFVYYEDKPKIKFKYQFRMKEEDIFWTYQELYNYKLYSYEMVELQDEYDAYVNGERRKRVIDEMLLDLENNK